MENITMKERKTVFTNGCFGKHQSGHVDVLQWSDSLVKVMIGINGDNSGKIQSASRRINNTEGNFSNFFEV